MRVLIADKFEQSGRDGLDAAGCEFSYQPDVKDDALVEAVRSYGPDVLVVRSTKVTEQMLDAGALKLIVRAGAGYNTIDVAGRLAPRRLRLELPGQELGRRRRARARAHTLLRPAHRRQRLGASRGPLEQEGVLEGARPSRANARPHRHGPDRTGSHHARARLRHARRRLEQESGRRARHSARRRAYGRPARRGARIATL